MTAGLDLHQAIPNLIHGEIVLLNNLLSLAFSGHERSPTLATFCPNVHFILHFSVNNWPLLSNVLGEFSLDLLLIFIDTIFLS